LEGRHELHTEIKEVMSLKIIITIGFLASFVRYNDAYNVQRTLNYEFPKKNFQYACPNSSKWVSLEIASPPFQIGSDYVNYGQTKQYFFTGPPVSTKLFTILDMVVLPSREVCVLGEKLKHYTLPNNSQFEIMLSIAAWFFPCILEPINAKRSYCFSQKLSSIGSDDNTKFEQFSEQLVAAIQKYYYLNNFLFRFE
jgi:hypothetical protein